jgi:hypothetical protein
MPGHSKLQRGASWWRCTSLRTGARRASASRRCWHSSTARCTRPHSLSVPVGKQVLHKRSSQGRARRVQVNETAAATGGTALEIVFVSSDRSESEMLSYMCESHGDWLGLSFREQTLEKQLSDKYGVRGIPMLVVVNAHDGSLITAEGTQDVEAGGSFCFQRWLGRMTQP